MILLIVLILAIVVGLIRGGTIQRLASLPLRQGGLALGALLLQSFLIYGPWFDRRETRSIAVGAMALSYLLLLAFVWLNRHLSGIAIIGLGLALNFLVTLANGGFMPTSPEALQRGGYTISASQVTTGSRLVRSKDILLAREETRLWFLSDIFVIPPPFPWPTVFSVGDVVIAVGTFAFMQKGLLGFSRDLRSSS